MLGQIQIYPGDYLILFKEELEKQRGGVIAPTLPVQIKLAPAGVTAPTSGTGHLPVLEALQQGEALLPHHTVGQPPGDWDTGPRGNTNVKQ